MENILAQIWHFNKQIAGLLVNFCLRAYPTFSKLLAWNEIYIGVLDS